MRIVIAEERRITVDLEGGVELRVESAGADLHFSPLHMLAASLATCTLAAVAAWASVARLDPAGLEIDLAWDYVEEPYRVGRYDMRVRWPGLPEARRAAALRVAKNCTVEHTLKHPPGIQLRLS